jgi:ATP-dependent exoDNAse (exonuclease V) alpha subunit
VDKRLTTEQCRHVESYKVGDMVRFNKPVRGFKRGVAYEVVNVAPFSFGPYKDQVIVRAKDEVAEALPMKHADRWTVYEPREREFGIGDEVLITRTMMTHTVGGRVRSRVIDQFDLSERGGMEKKTELTNGSRHRIIDRTFDGHFVLAGKKILDKDCGHFTHGYCMTAHASQSMTADSAILVGTSDQFAAINSPTFLVAATRARHTFKVYTDDLDGLAEAAAKDQEHVGAFELLETGTSAVSEQKRREQEHEEFEHYRQWQRAAEHEKQQEYEHER